MIEKNYPGGWYADALPDGRFAVLIANRHLETDYGPVPLPNGQNLLFLVRGPDRRIAGQGNTDGLAWEWDGTSWTAQVGPTFGPYAVIYDQTGNLLINRAYPPYAFRYVDETNHVVSGGATMADLARRLWEWTTRGDLTIGQGETGMVALYRGVRYRLANGITRMIRFHREGDALALAWWQDNVSARIRWLTVDEVCGYPVEIVPLSPPPQPPPALPHVALSVTTSPGALDAELHTLPDSGPVTETRIAVDGTNRASNLPTLHWPTTPGSHLIEGRASGPGGRRDADLVTVEVPAPPPAPPPPPTPPPKLQLRGLVCWGEQEPADVYASLTKLELVRLVCFHLPVNRIAAAIAVPQQAGKRVVASIRGDQIPGLPDGAEFALWNEPEGTGVRQLTPQQYAADFLAHREEIVARGLRGWVGEVGSPDPFPLAYLHTLLDLIPHDLIAGVSLHRYKEDFASPPPEGRAAYHGDRAMEHRAIQAATCGLPLLIGEFAWEAGKKRYGWGFWPFGHTDRVTDQQVLTWTEAEFVYWGRLGVAACLFQIGGSSGIRRDDGTYRPVANLFR